MQHTRGFRRAYLSSNDFNGVHYGSLPLELMTELRPLLEAGLIYANFGQRMVNPFILGLPPEAPGVPSHRRDWPTSQ